MEKYGTARPNTYDNTIWCMCIACWVTKDKDTHTHNTILDDDQRDAHLLYFTIYLLHSSTFFNVLLTVHFCDD